MYLILKTFATCADMADAALTSCAVLEVTTKDCETWRGLMAHARLTGAALGKDLTLSWADFTPECYQGMPDTEGFADFSEGALDGGWCLLSDTPFPPSDEGYSEDPWGKDAWHVPVDLSYCEIRVSRDSVQWFFGPKRGSVEEYTAHLSAHDLDDIQAMLTQRKKE